MNDDKGCYNCKHSNNSIRTSICDECRHLAKDYWEEKEDKLAEIRKDLKEMLLPGDCISDKGIKYFQKKIRKSLEKAFDKKFSGTCNANQMYSAIEDEFKKWIL